MDDLTLFLTVLIISLAGIFSIVLRKKTKEKYEYQLDLIDWLIVTLPPLAVLAPLMLNSGINKGWYLLPYFAVMVVIFAIWFLRKNNTQKKISRITIVLILIGMVAIGLSLFSYTV